MNRRLTKFTAFFLIAATLFASTGVVIASHVCSSRNESDVSFFQHKGCCGKQGNHCTSIPSTEKTIKKNCCQLSISYHKLNVSSTIQNGPVHTIGLPITIGHLYRQQNTVLKAILPEYKNKSGGIDLLLRLHLLLI